MSEGQRGLAAVRAGKYKEALELLNRALESSDFPPWLLARAKANQQLKKFDDALADAESAYHSAISRGSGPVRKLLIEAQYRRACSLHQLKKFADADCCAKWSMLLAEGRLSNEADGIEKKVDAQGNYTVTKEEVLADKKDMPKRGGKSDSMSSAAMALATGSDEDTGYTTEWNMAHMLRVQCIGAMEKLPADDPGRKISVTKSPAKHGQRKSDSQLSKPVAKQMPIGSQIKGSDAKTTEANKTQHPDEKLKLRSDFYQTNQNINISLYAKDVKKEALVVKFMNDKVLIGPIPREAAPHLPADARQSFSTIFLMHHINTAGSSFSVTPSKIELVLQKASPEKWSSWGKEEIGDWVTDGEANAIQLTPAIVTGDTQASEAAETVPKPMTGHVYPTSSKSGPKNWDKMAAEVKDEVSGDADTFFQQLYQSATPDAQRAMMKSYIESNGTTLSTDWSDIGSRTVEVNPPEGMQARRWDS